MDTGLGALDVTGDPEDVRTRADAAHFARMLFEHRMRAGDERRRYADAGLARQMLRTTWQQIAKIDVSVTAQSVQIGRVTLPRRGPDVNAVPASGSAAGSTALTRATSAGHARLHSDLHSASTPALEWLATCSQRGWMAILATPDVRAAADTVRLLAAATAQPLVELPLTPASDTSELLGGFEQLDPARALLTSAQSVLSVAVAVSLALLTSPTPSLRERLDAASAIARATPPLESLATSDGGSSPPVSAATTLTMLHTMLHALDAACVLLAGTGPTQVGLAARVAACTEAVAAAAAGAAAAETATVGGRFQWVDGLLLAAIGATGYLCCSRTSALLLCSTV
jgi:midasin